MSKNFTLLRKIGREQDLFHTPSGPPTFLDTLPGEEAAREVPHEEFPRRELPRQEVPRHVVPRCVAEPRKHVAQIRSQDVIKDRISGVSQDKQKRTQQQRDREKIRYREEVKLVQRIFPLNAQSTPQLVLFSSMENEADSWSIAARSAEVLAARAEGPVCVIDANLRSPQVHRYFNVENRRGFSDSVCGPGPAQDFAQYLSSRNLWLMTAGSAAAQMDVPEISKRVSSRMIELRTLFKYIVVNSPLHLERLPSLQSFASDGLVLIVEANTTRRETVRQVMDDLEIVGTRLLGVVLNNRTFPIPDAIYHKF